MAYEMLTGRLPFIDRGIMGLIAAHARETPPDPATILVDFPPEASQSLLAALSKDPQARPTPSELMARLRAVPDSSWPKPARPAAVVDGQTRRGANTAPTSPPAGVRRRSNRRWILAAAVVVPLSAVIAGLIAATVVHGKRPPRASLKVNSTAVRASMLTGRCPRAQWIFTADLRTNGSAGMITFHWLRPDGKQTQEQTLHLVNGQTSQAVVLRFTVTGSRPLTGAATLQLTSPPRQASSPRVAYSCG
jgi:serine/threonine protein kinase